MKKKELEALQNELRCKRRALVQALEDYEKDCNAMIRVAKMDSELYQQKCTYGGSLKDEVKMQIKERYSDLDFLKVSYDKNDPESRMMDALRIIYRSEDEKSVWRTDKRGKETLPRDAVWNDDIIWDMTQMKLYLKMFKKYGYTEFYYTNASTGALENIAHLISLGATIKGTTRISEYREGLIFDLTNVDTTTFE